MKILWQAISLPKNGNRLEENEDAYYPIGNERSFSRRRKFTCAISDGATRTSFSSLWANLLVKNPVIRKEGVSQQSIISAQTGWTSAINSMNLPWHAEEKVKQGSYATLLWFRLQESAVKPGGYFKATALGDSCLFQIRNCEILTIFPIKNAESFAEDPVLISSLSVKNQHIWATLTERTIRGCWQSGDQFLLMTDALAHWFIKQLEMSESPITKITDILDEPVFTQYRFEQLVSNLRSADEIKNDDTTLVRLLVSGD